MAPPESQTQSQKPMYRNSSERYGWIAIVLHWTMALGVFGLFGLGLYMVELSYYDSWYRGSLATHKSLGVLLGVLFLVRLIWRVSNPVPRGLSDKAIENRAAELVHRGLYLLMAALFVSGYLISTADGRSIEVLELFSLPATMTGKQQEDIAGEVHNFLAWTLIAGVVLHAMAAIKHHFINKDGTLARMFRPGKN